MKSRGFSLRLKRKLTNPLQTASLSSYLGSKVGGHKSWFLSSPELCHGRRLSIFFLSLFLSFRSFFSPVFSSAEPCHGRRLPRPAPPNQRGSLGFTLVSRGSLTGTPTDVSSRVREGDRMGPGLLLSTIGPFRLCGL